MMRDKRGMTQEQMLSATGITERQYRRLELDKMKPPRLDYLVNCAIVLGCEVTELIEPRWLQWHEFVTGLKAPARPSDLWKV